MPLIKLPIKPGINREITNYAGEGGYYDGDKIRFRFGYVEKIGGWVTNSANSFAGVCRSLFQWVSLAAESLIATGTNQRYYIQNSGVFYPITPIVRTVTLGTDPFATVSGTNLVTVTDAGFVSTIGSYVTFTGVATFNGLTLNGSYEIVTAGAGTYQIYAPGATGTGSGGGAAVVANYELAAGAAINAATGGGWGAPPWGSGGWGSGSGGIAPMTLWSQSNWGQDLLFAVRSGAMYYWVKNTTADSNGNYTPAVTINTYAGTQVKTTKAATFGGVTSTITVPDTLSIDVGAIVSGTNIQPGTYVTTTWDGSTSVPISMPTTGASSGNYTFSYSGNTAPVQVSQIVVFAIYQFAVALGATPYDPTNFTPTFNPMLVRWSDQSVVAEWTPTTFNQSGEELLSSGSYIVGGVTTRQELLIWTDKALYSMQYIGAPFVFSFNILMDNISIMSPNAMITVNNITYWMGVDKFYTYSGTVQMLPCTVREYVFENMNTQQQYQVVCGHNEEYSEIWWHYPSTNSSTNDSYVFYNYMENLWCFGTMNRTAWYDTPLSNFPLGVISVQDTYLSTAMGTSDTVIPVVNSASFPTSGAVYVGTELIQYTGNIGSALTGLTRLVPATHTIYTQVVFYQANQIVLQEDGTDSSYRNGVGGFSTDAIYAYAETTDFDINGGEHFAFVSRIVPDLSFEDSTTGSNPQVLMTLKPRAYPGYPYTVATTGTASGSVVSAQPAPTPPATYPVEQYTGVLYTRLRGRQLAYRVESSRIGTAWRLGMLRFDIRPDGRR